MCLLFQYLVWNCLSSYTEILNLFWPCENVYLSVKCRLYVMYVKSIHHGKKQTKEKSIHHGKSLESITKELKVTNAKYQSSVFLLLHKKYRFLF